MSTKHQDFDLYIGASRGVGLELAREGVRRQRQTVVVARHPDRIDTPELKDVRRIRADVSTKDGCQELQRAEVLNAPRLFWIAGAYCKGPFEDTEALWHVLDMHQKTMMRIVFQTYRERFRLQENRLFTREPWRHYPLDLVVMGSVSAFKLRKYEAVYAAAKAGQAAFLRTFSVELRETLPGSRILLVNCGRIGDAPGEQKIDDGGRRIDPAFVAKTVWNVLEGKPTDIMDRPFTELTFERTNGTPDITFGPQRPEIPR